MTQSRQTTTHPTLTLFGNLTITENGHTKAANKKPLLVPAAVALHPNRRLHRDDLARLVWPDQSEAKARLSLRQARYQINEWCETPCLIFDGDFLTITPGAAVDLWRFEEAIADGRAEDAIELHKGHLLQSMIRRIKGQFASEIEARATRVQTQLRGAYQDLIRHHLTEGRLDAAKRLAREIAKQEPLDERTQIQLVETLRGCGEYRAALAAYAGYASLLESELGDVPSEYLKEVIDEIREAVESSSPPLPRFVAASHTVTTNVTTKVADLAVRRVGMAFSAGLLAASLIAFMAWPRPDPWPAGVTLDLPLGVEGRSPGEYPARWLDLVISDGSVSYGLPFESVPNTVRMAGSDTFARGVEVASGSDLVVSGPDGDRIVKSEAADEHPLAWGPAGRKLLFRSGARTNEGYRISLRTLDLDSDAEVTLASYLGRHSFGVDWSPTGTVLAVIAAEQGSPAAQLALMSPQGEVLGTRETVRGRPTWSPRGTRVAYLDVSEGQHALVSVDRNGDDFRTHLRLPAQLTTPVWLTERIIAFVADFGLGGDVWAWDTLDERLVQLTERQDVRGLRTDAIDRSSLGWLNDLTFDQLGSVVTAPEAIGILVEDVRLETEYAPTQGEYFWVEATATWDGSGRSALRADALDWTAEGGVATSQTPGLVRLTDGAGGVVHADYLGWTQARLDVTGARLVTGAPEEVFSEDWSEGALARNWIAFGEPLPTLDRTSGVFISNGDQNYLSGAVSAIRLDMSEGLSLEVEGRIPLTEGLFQDFVIGFAQGPPEQPASPSFRRTGDIKLSIGHDWLSVDAAGRLLVSRIPIPESAEHTLTYGLQVAPDGRITVTVDGRIYVRTHVDRVPDSTRVLIAGNTLGTRIEHGAVRVYRGLRVEVR